jgi:hypothetical protein
VVVSFKALTSSLPGEVINRLSAGWPVFGGSHTRYCCDNPSGVPVANTEV